MDFSLGLIAFQNISKSVDFFLAYSLTFLGIAFGVWHFKAGRTSESTDVIFWSDWKAFICLWIGICICLLKLSSDPYIRGFTTIAGLVLLVLMVQNRKQRFLSGSSNILFGLIIFLSINIKLLSNTSGLISIAVVNTTFILLIHLVGIKGTLIAAAIFVAKNLANSQDVLSDAFHSAEQFAAFLQNESGATIFPNVGYLEEWIPNFLIQSANTISNNQISISLIEGRYLIGFLFAIGIFLILYKKDNLFGVLTYLFLPVDRISLLFVILYSLIGLSLSERQKKWWLFTLLLLLPLLFLVLSPSYGLILILPVAWMCLSNLRVNFIVPIVTAWCCQLYYFSNYFHLYLEIYSALSKSNLVAHGAPFFKPGEILPSFPSFRNLKTYCGRILFVFLLGVVLGQLYRLKTPRVTGYLRHSLIIILGALTYYLYIQYAFTRIDEYGYSRIIPIGLGLAIVILYINKLYKRVIYLPLFICAYLTSTDLIDFNPKHYSLNHSLSWSTPFIEFSTENLAISTSIIDYSNGKKVILFGNQPALIASIPNALLPPFTTPWVAVGEFSQIKNIKFFDAHTAPIYIGKNFLSNDDLDARARSPLVFKFLSKRYHLVEFKGLLFAEPNASIGGRDKLLFSGFDIGNTAEYIKAHPKTTPTEIILLECGDFKSIKRVKIVAENNYFYANMHCGKNLIPKVYLDGSLVRIDEN